ncbi:hypothetical protein FWF74_01370 [Candidatus Saccharibacteria bacterium]|nr:hypothetical protein [Candidatus Saccharibacteria bacterium]MCL1963128.1 hypothetical protein [Candidatus Saccharibacteria bacterium]
MLKKILIIGSLIMVGLITPFMMICSSTIFAASGNMVTDPDTHRVMENFDFSTLRNGRLWVDKTVSLGSVDWQDENDRTIGYSTSYDDEFLVTLSALAQNYSVSSFVLPSDVVFVIDLSLSMNTSLGGASRFETMVAALNNASRELMQNSTDNRFAVVAYGGVTTPILKLGHYTVPMSGDFFEIAPGPAIRVNSEIANADVVSRTTAVSGSTPTQRGIYEGAKILLDNADTNYIHTVNQGLPDERLVTIPRKPVIVLLTDGEPTYGWTDYKTTNYTNTNYDIGNGSTADFGTDVLTVMTAAYWKQRVDEHYYSHTPSNAAFYTIGVGVAGSVNAKAVLDPKNNAGANTKVFSGQTYNMQTLLGGFVNNGTATFPVLRSGTMMTQLTTAKNDGGYVYSTDYANGYYAAESEAELHDAFASIQASIVSKGNYATSSDYSNPNATGYLTFVDVIGENMEFREGKGLRSGGRSYFGADFAYKIINETHSTWWDAVMGQLAFVLGLSLPQAEDLMMSCVAGGAIYYNPMAISDDDSETIIIYYADSSGVYVDNYYAMDGSVNAVPAGATTIIERRPKTAAVIDEIGNIDTDLFYSAITIIEALDDITYTVNVANNMTVSLIKGQQVIKWSIPQSLIPVRTVYPKYDAFDQVEDVLLTNRLPVRLTYTVGMKAGADKTCTAPKCYLYTNEWEEDSAFAFFTPNEYNPYYIYQEDTPLYVLAGGSYVEAFTYSSEETYYIQEEYFDKHTAGYLNYTYQQIGDDAANVAVDGAGKPYIPAGTLKRATNTNHHKSENRTDTAEFYLNSTFVNNLKVYSLGNNGRLELTKKPTRFEMPNTGKYDDIKSTSKLGGLILAVIMIAMISGLVLVKRRT